MEIAAMRAFRRLYKYITGANENGVYVCVHPHIHLFFIS